MINRLLPDQIAQFWDLIKYAVEHSLPPIVAEHPDKMNRILSSALSGGIDVWASYNKGEGTNKFEGLILTKFLYDDSSNTKSLLIYCLYGFSEFAKDSWNQGINAIAKYAKSRGCAQIVAYTDSHHIINIVKRLGGNASYTYLKFNIDEIV